jgi:hypothetical protein
MATSTREAMSAAPRSPNTSAPGCTQPVLFSLGDVDATIAAFAPV